MNWNRIEEWGRRTWPITIVLSIFALSVAGYALHRMISADRPTLTLATAAFSGPFLPLGPAGPPMLTLMFVNTGSASGHRGTVTLFTISEDGRRRESLGKSEIGGYDVIIPNAHAGAYIPVHDAQTTPGIFLACVQYYDPKDNAYDERYLLRPRATSLDRSTPLDPSLTRVACG
jgi:hypothetical protein